MIKVIYKGSLVVDIPREKLELWFIFRKYNIKPKAKCEINLKLWKTFDEGFEVYEHYGGLWICKDFEVYPVDYLKIYSLLENDEELIIEWELVDKKEVFWLENCLIHIKDFDELKVNYKVAVNKKLADLIEKVSKKNKKRKK